MEAFGLRHAQELPHVRFLESDTDIVRYSYDRYSKLTRELNHFVTLLHIGCHIVFRIHDVVCNKEFLREIAIVTVGGAVDSDCFHTP